MKAYNIGDCIRQLREEQNVNQEDLCRGLCSKSTLSRICLLYTSDAADEL